MFLFILGILIFVVALIGFLVSFVINCITKRYSNSPIIWYIVLNIGNILIQISRFLIQN